MSKNERNKLSVILAPLKYYKDEKLFEKDHEKFKLRAMGSL